MAAFTCWLFQLVACRSISMAKIIKYRAVRTMVTRTSIDEFSESGPHGTELRDLFVDPRQMVFGDMLHGSALPSIILIES